jgi:outer membrane usher protein FimD/PapC
LSINDLDDAAPTITSGDTAITIDENSGSEQVVYTATADDSEMMLQDTPNYVQSYLLIAMLR